MQVTDLLPHIVSGEMLRYSDDGSYVTTIRHTQVRWLRRSWLYRETVVDWAEVAV